MNILILTSKTGGGHISLAEAIRDLLERDIPSAEREPVSTARQTPTITIADPQPGFFEFHYRLVSRHALRLWAAEFQLLDTPRRALSAHRIFTHLVRRQLHALLDTTRPDLILTTYPFFSYEVMRVLEERASTVPLVLLFSDANSVHHAWLTERQAAATFATTRETYKQALEAGFAPERLHLVGWPVRAQFFEHAHASSEARAQQLTRLGLDPLRFTIFLQGGGEGAAHVDRTIENIVAMNAPGSAMQIILAVGKNTALQERYCQVAHLAVLPYTKEIGAFMAAADVIMGKAGPNMLFESVMLGKPFIATAFIPGQEEENLAFIRRHGLGWVALHPTAQRSLLTSLTRQPDHLRDMLATIETYRQWNAEMNAQIAPMLRSLAMADLAAR
ncbi:MAG TPA: glycosyltransferase [Ktedonobacterales bacterium]|nr:glycosyltransferase [Ktedonobacterales bacterium]